MAISGIELQVYDRDLPFGDWINYIVSYNDAVGGPDGSHLFKASNITNRIEVNKDLLCTPKFEIDIYNMLVSSQIRCEILTQYEKVDTTKS